MAREKGDAGCRRIGHMAVVAWRGHDGHRFLTAFAFSWRSVLAALKGMKQNSAAQAQTDVITDDVLRKVHLNLIISLLAVVCIHPLWHWLGLGHLQCFAHLVGHCGGSGFRRNRHHTSWRHG